eukprot:535632-Prorocentrum_minimum.AAC.8
MTGVAVWLQQQGLSSRRCPHLQSRREVGELAVHEGGGKVACPQRGGGGGRLEEEGLREGERLAHLKGGVVRAQAEARLHRPCEGLGLHVASACRLLQPAPTTCAMSEEMAGRRGLELVQRYVTEFDIYTTLKCIMCDSARAPSLWCRCTRQYVRQ